MSEPLILPATVNKHGEVVGSRRRMLELIPGFLEKLDPRRPWEVLVRPWKKSRSNEQNKALFGLAYKYLCADTGYDKDELHEEFCKRFFGRTTYEFFGETREKPVRTTTRNEAGKRDVIGWDVFSDFYSLVERVAAELGILIPPPDPKWKTRGAKGKRHASESASGDELPREGDV